MNKNERNVFSTLKDNNVEVILSLYKNTIGKKLLGGDFEFGLFDKCGKKIQKAKNDKYGLIKFPCMLFDKPGDHEYYVKEIFAADDCCIDPREYPVIIKITKEKDELIAYVFYPEGMPGFKSVCEEKNSGLIEFPEIIFDEVGVYEYTLRELTPSDCDWDTDPSIKKVIITVTDDGYGNLIATTEYSDEQFPEFINVYKPKLAHIISASKKAVGARLSEGRFEFGLFDKNNKLVAKAENGPEQ